jgi:hypothetical protein
LGKENRERAPGGPEPTPSDHPPTSVAEVQLHSGQGEQAEMGQLREQLISAFQEQMDVRRCLLELENHAMEVQIDTSRHLLTIAGYALLPHDPLGGTPRLGQWS